MESPNNIVVWTGSRDYNNPDNIAKIMVHHLARFHLVGDCTGVDSLIKQQLDQQGATILQCSDQVSFNQLDLATITGTVVIVFIAEWKGLGKRAGPIRNGVMLQCAQILAQKYESTTQLVAIHPNLAESKGTTNMINQARRKNIPIRLYTI